MLFDKPIEEVEFMSCNVITNIELIEHLFWPKDFLIACRKALKNDGLLFITTPNIKGFDLLVLEELSDNIAGPNHLNYFHPMSLSLLLESCGFEILDIKTPGELDAQIVRKKILSGQFDISNQPFLSNILIHQWDQVGEQFQHFLSNNNLSSHLWIVAKKK